MGWITILRLLQMAYHPVLSLYAILFGARVVL